MLPPIKPSALASAYPPVKPSAQYVGQTATPTPTGQPHLLMRCRVRASGALGKRHENLVLGPDVVG